MKSVLVFFLMIFSSVAWAGPNNVGLNIERKMVSVAIDLAAIRQDVDEIVKVYFSTSASTLVGATAGGDAVTVAAKLTKTKFVNGITMAQQLQNFFTNQVVATNDYTSSAVNLINGSNAAAQALSQDVEVIGNKLVLLGTNSIALKKSCQSILSAYNSSELAAALVPVSLTTVVFGSDVTKQLFVDGMNLCQQVNNFYDNVAVTQGDWISVITKWAQGF